METPIADFVRRYADSGMVRAHMPGHKGKPFLGCEALDITEIQGADSLYEAEGIIRRSESYAGELFGSGRTVYSTEGSSQCIRAMLYLALTCGNGSRTVVAARNVHRAFVYAAALLDFEIVWLWPERSSSLCGCPVSPDTLERTLTEMSEHSDSIALIKAFDYRCIPSLLSHACPLRRSAPALPKGEAWAKRRSLTEYPKPLPLGEVSPKVTERASPV